MYLCSYTKMWSSCNTRRLFVFLMAVSLFTVTDKNRKKRKAMNSSGYTKWKIVGIWQEVFDFRRQIQKPEPVFVNLLGSPGIDSQHGGIDSSESIPGLLKRLKIRAQDFFAVAGFDSKDTTPPPSQLTQAQWQIISCLLVSLLYCILAGRRFVYKSSGGE